MKATQYRDQSVIVARTPRPVFNANGGRAVRFDLLALGGVMKDVEFRKFPKRNTVLIGLGTVFGTLGVILVGLFIGWNDTRMPLFEVFAWLIVYGVVGSILALAICAGIAVPMLLLWFPTQDWLRKDGYTLPRATMATAGGLSFFGAVSVCAFTDWQGAAHFPLPLWPLILVPVGISMFLANSLSYDRSGAVWE